MKQTILSKKHADFCTLIGGRRKELKDAGILESTISLWASGRRIPTYSYALRIAEILKVDINLIPYRITIIT